jgi:hypothetical protein
MSVHFLAVREFAAAWLESKRIWEASHSAYALYLCVLRGLLCKFRIKLANTRRRD